jgi:hypothetical protein
MAAATVDLAGKAAAATDPMMAATKKGEGNMAGPTKQGATPDSTRQGAFDASDGRSLKRRGVVGRRRGQGGGRRWRSERWRLTHCR